MDQIFVSREESIYEAVEMPRFIMNRSTDVPDQAMKRAEPRTGRG